MPEMLSRCQALYMEALYYSRYCSQLYYDDDDYCHYHYHYHTTTTTTTTTTAAEKTSTMATTTTTTTTTTTATTAATATPTAIPPRRIGLGSLGQGLHSHDYRDDASDYYCLLKLPRLKRC